MYLTIVFKLYTMIDHCDVVSLLHFVVVGQEIRVSMYEPIVVKAGNADVERRCPILSRFRIITMNAVIQNYIRSMS